MKLSLVSFITSILFCQMVNGDEFDLSPQLLDKFDWFFAPLLNPDGYEYSHATVSRRTLLSVWMSLRLCRVMKIKKRNFSLTFWGLQCSANIWFKSIRYARSICQNNNVFLCVITLRRYCFNFNTLRCFMF